MRPQQRPEQDRHAKRKADDHERRKRFVIPVLRAVAVNGVVLVQPAAARRRHCASAALVAEIDGLATERLEQHRADGGVNQIRQHEQPLDRRLRTTPPAGSAQQAVLGRNLDPRRQHHHDAYADDRVQYVVEVIRRHAAQRDELEELEAQEREFVHEVDEHTRKRHAEHRLRQQQHLEEAEHHLGLAHQVALAALDAALQRAAAAPV